MFQFPRFPPPPNAVGHLSPDGVAPFGLPGIAGCQHLPQAFRCVATSFIGCLRQGIHPVLFSDYVAMSLVSFFVSVMVRAVIPLVSSTLADQDDPLSILNVLNRYSHTMVEPRGFEPRTSAVQGRRSPRLSYGPLPRSHSTLPFTGWARLDSNQGPRPYQGRALTT